ncbi:hypothetical protein [Paenibacillus sp. GCM10028914]|uniref:hypothetical protein n=1 Tax=Paenibacillus sp. GCM10028914 TaxID=3273416 RepID=UPI003620EC24
MSEQAEGNYQPNFLGLVFDQTTLRTKDLKENRFMEIVERKLRLNRIEQGEQQ